MATMNDKHSPTRDVMIPMRNNQMDIFSFGTGLLPHVTSLSKYGLMCDALVTPATTTVQFWKLSPWWRGWKRASDSNRLPGAHTDATHRARQTISKLKANRPVRSSPTRRRNHVNDSEPTTPVIPPSDIARPTSNSLSPFA